jgi:Leucine-rich repeat (LRR) protein
MDVRSKAPSKRRKISTSSQMEHVQRTVRTEESRELREPSEDDGTQSFDEEGDVGVLWTWRAMCPELEDRWPEDELPKDWEGVTMENGRVVKLVLEGFGLTGAVPAEIGRLSALRELKLRYNELTSVPAEIGQLTSLRTLDLTDNQLTSVPAEIGQLTSLTELYLCNNQLTRACMLTIVPAAIRELEAAGCEVDMDDDETRPRGAWLVGGSIVYYK